MWLRRGLVIRGERHHSCESHPRNNCLWRVIQKSEGMFWFSVRKVIISTIFQGGDRSETLCWILGSKRSLYRARSKKSGNNPQACQNSGLGTNRREGIKTPHAKAKDQFCICIDVSLRHWRCIALPADQW